MLMLRQQLHCLALLLLMAVAGCASQPIGLIYTNVTNPQSVGAGYPCQRSESCAMSYFGLITVGDASVYRAMKVGKLGRASLVERQISGALGIYRYCTVVYGYFGDPGPPPEDNCAKIDESSSNASHKDVQP